MNGPEDLPTEAEIDNNQGSDDSSNYEPYDEFVENASEEDARQEIDRP